MSDQADLQFSFTDRGRVIAMVSTWGLFSPRALDEGSQLLLEHVDVHSVHDDVLDIGCGTGVLGIALGLRAPQGQTHLVDKDFVAVAYAQKNALANGLAHASVYLSNGLQQVSEIQTFDLIVSNLPGKVGRELLHAFITDSFAHLKPGGQLCVVTITGIREYIKKEFLATFGNYEKVKQGARYTVARAIKSA